MSANLTIRDGLDNVRAEKKANWPRGLARLSDLEQSLEQLAEEYGPDCEGPWNVVITRFHGGGIVSTHRSVLAAIRAARKWRGNTDCTCGCCGVVPASRELPGTETNNRNGYSPYTLTR